MNMQTPAPLSDNMESQLAGLHDIHLPEPVSWWALAPGWWALACLAIVTFLCFLIVRQYRRRSLKQAALRELAMLQETHSDEYSVQSLATEVGVLTRWPGQ